jgi:hypothetical protein
MKLVKERYAIIRSAICCRVSPAPKQLAFGIIPILGRVMVSLRMVSVGTRVALSFVFEEVIFTTTTVAGAVKIKVKGWVRWSNIRRVSAAARVAKGNFRRRSGVFPLLVVFGIA